MPLGNPLPSPNFQLAVADVLPAAAQLRSPVPGVPVPSAAGGTLAAGTYFYTVTATNASGESIAGPQVSATTTGATGSVALAWPAVPGATGYRVYRRTTAGGAALYQVIASATNSFVDAGAAGTGGTEPAASWQVVSLLNSWDADYSENVSEYDVFGLADPIAVNGRAKSTMSFGGFLPDSTDTGSNLIQAHQTAKDYILVRVLWDGTNGFSCIARVQTNKVSAKAGANLIEITYTFIVLPSSLTIIGVGPLL
jgi:hypothetical protein